MPSSVSAVVYSAFGLSLVAGLACTTNHNTYGTQQGDSGAGGALNGSGGSNTPGSGGASMGGAGATNGGSAAGGSAGAVAMGGGGVAGAEESYEAEDAFFGAQAELGTAISGASGRGYVDALASSGARLIFTVNAAADGMSSLSLTYAGGARKVAVYVNGSRRGDVNLPESSGKFAAFSHAVRLRRGLNTVGYVNEDGASNELSIDKLDMTGGLARPTRGAILPFIEHEAEDGMTNGSVLDPDRTYGTVASEASGRRAVRLDAVGKFVEWTSTDASNALSVRYSMPDAPEGGGQNGTLTLYVDGQKRQALSVTSKYAWIYGDWPFNGKPSDGKAHRFFDESRYLVGDIPAGAKIKLQRDDGDADVTVDLIDLETAPEPYAQPDGALSLTDFGAKPDDGVDDSGALTQAIQAAKTQKKELFVPAGTFDMKSRVDVGGVTIRGAGPWHTVFAGAVPSSGFNGAGDAVTLADFTISGDVQVRVNADLDSGLDGNFGTGSLFQNLWIEHMKTGIWLIGPTSGAYVVGCRIHNTIADGVNLHKGVQSTAVEHLHVRGTGDDALAMYSEGVGSNGNRFAFDTLRLPLLANGAAIYGGSDNTISDMDIADTVTASAGIVVGTRKFENGTLSLGGFTRVARSTLLRTGGHEPNWNSDFGGLWIFADPDNGEQGNITSPVIVEDLEIVDSTYQGILVSSNRNVSSLALSNVTIDGAGSVGIEVSVNGGGKFEHVSVSGAQTAAKISPDFQATQGDGNSGW